MAKWIVLTEVTGDEPDGRPLFVNFDQVCSFHRLKAEAQTKIWFLAGQDDGVAYVEEEPHEIFQRAGVRDPSR